MLRNFCLLICTFFLGHFANAQDPVADNMLLYQRNIGGWPKLIGEQKIDYTKELSPAEKAGVIDDSGMNDATIDNNATYREIRYLINAFKATGNQKYLKSVERGIRYLLKMQYPNGGFPQFYPDSSKYRGDITYNDNAMTNALDILWDVSNGAKGLDAVDQSLVAPSKDAVRRGIDCILKTQIRVNGKLTAWCAQYDKRTLQPANARTFELISISGDESVGIINFLMKIPNPSDAIITAINSAVEWFEKSAINGYKYVEIPEPSLPKGKDRVLQPDPGSTLWARFYDIQTNKPFFCGRDGVKKWNVADIEYERRTGYTWYGTWAQDLLARKYPEWKKKNGL